MSHQNQFSSRDDTARHLETRLRSLNLASNGKLEGQDEITQNEQTRFSQVGRKKDFVHIERIGGKPINVVQGLELHTRVFNVEEQKKIVDYIYTTQSMGQAGKLRARTYSEPRKWMRGKGRVTIQFGCCYNYAVDKNGNPPGIIRDEEVDPIPALLKSIIRRLVRWHVLPPTCIPNSCIVNIYDEGDCIPPHIDHHDFLRPFCTVSLLTESNILFGSNLKIVGPGEFSGPVAIPLPVGSVLILKGNGADVAKHCVPAVPGKRISITFRKMDDSKLPYNFSPDPELQGLKPIVLSPLTKSPGYPQQTHRPNQLLVDGSEAVQHPQTKSLGHPQQRHRHNQLFVGESEEVQRPKHVDHHNQRPVHESEVIGKTSSDSFFLSSQSDFPPLGGGPTTPNSRPRMSKRN